ncbi:alcohol dehydrogenase, iron-dependent [Paucilactobacillus vaccinostercus DSM 20634]|uniref:Alcohol dehydrogenase, iron-dependent n=1 Tax=Paucilactobacillus vaccinostercus DSM 20634 TaxID=1423813 RepID=A0A0R2AAV3_9LACO|nr:iron-containing alcohol dehydrogenase [Paucilactobacillus vaccinostercus]KRM60857.1 alcohol dehydrogenase, iron-dependent [Paucilactobacillus vaccinostercus DSM 20634]
MIVKISMLQKVKVVVEHDLADAVMKVLAIERLHRPFIVMDEFLKDTAQVKKLLTVFQREGIEFTAYVDVIPDPPARIINDGAQQMNQSNSDCVIAIGGGSSLDSAKGINIVATNGGTIQDYVTDDSLVKTGKCLISVPTTAGTGSEMSNALVVTDEKTSAKNAILSDNMLSDYALLIPEMTITLPKRMTIASGLDAFSHAAEGYLSKLSTPMTDAICEKVMFLLDNYLPSAVKDGTNLELRERVLVASSLAGWMLNNAGTNVGHSAAHILGAQFHMVHGEAVAYALPGVLQLVADAETKKVKEIGKILGASFTGKEDSQEIAAITVSAYKNFRDNLVGLHPFSDYGISQDQLLDNTTAILHERFAGNTPIDLTQENVTELLKNFGQ